MDVTALIHSDTFTFVILPILIFCSRICDVTLDTIRIIYVSRGMKFVAPVLGFFEILIWLLAITQIMQHLTSPIHYIAYAAGFGVGNFVGIIVEEKLSVGTVLVRIITRKDTTDLRGRLTKSGYRTTWHEATGHSGPVNITFSIVARKELRTVIKILRECNPTAFYTIEDIKYAAENNPIEGSSAKKAQFWPIRRLGK